MASMSSFVSIPCCDQDRSSSPRPLTLASFRERGRGTCLAMTIRRLDSILADRIAAARSSSGRARRKGIARKHARAARPASTDHRGRRQKLIRIIDDGCGIDPPTWRCHRTPRHLERVPMATSTNIATLGFRGEALPSIASVARLESSPALKNRRMAGPAGRFGEDRRAGPGLAGAGNRSRCATCSPPRRRGSNSSKAARRGAARRRCRQAPRHGPSGCALRSAAKALTGYAIGPVQPDREGAGSG